MHSRRLYFYLLPLFSILFIFGLFPTLWSFILSFFEWDGISPQMKYIGLRNYIQLFLRDGIFWKALRNNLWFLIIKVTIQIPLAFFLALLLNSKLLGGWSKVFGLLWFFPLMASVSVVGMLWTRMLAPYFGLLNAFLTGVGLRGLSRAWLGNSKTALGCLIAMDIWQSTSFAMIIFLGALKGIPSALLEAAEMEGANDWQKIWYIILPNVRPVVSTLVILTSMFAFQKFGIIWVVTQGGPSHTTEVLATWMYRQAFWQNRFGYGCAIAMVLLGIALLWMGVSTILRRRK